MTSGDGTGDDKHARPAEDRAPDSCKPEPEPEWVEHADYGDDNAKSGNAPTRIRIADRARERPEIRIGTDIVVMADDASKALAPDNVTYQRGGALVHVTHVDDETRGARLPVGSPMIRVMAPPTLCERLSHCARWIRYDGRSERFKEVTPDDKTVRATHARGSWPGVRVLVGVTETPTLRLDGTVSQTPGYDPHPIRWTV